MSEAPLILPKIRTSMQMSKVSVDALKSEVHHKESTQQVNPLMTIQGTSIASRKQNIRIQQFALVGRIDGNSKITEPKSVTFKDFRENAKNWSQFRTPTSEGSCMTSTFSELAKEGRRNSWINRRMSALVPNLQHIFKEDTHPATAPESAIQPAPVHNVVSSEELEESAPPIVCVEDLRRAAFRRNATMKFTSMPPSAGSSPQPVPRVSSPQWHANRYMMETAKVMASTQTILKKHTMQRLPKRLFKDIV